VRGARCNLAGDHAGRDDPSNGCERGQPAGHGGV